MRQPNRHCAAEGAPKRKDLAPVNVIASVVQVVKGGLRIELQPVLGGLTFGCAVATVLDHQDVAARAGKQAPDVD